MQKTLDFSIVLACYNDAKYLEENVNEMFKVLDMTVLRYEVIFVYDCGQDNTLEIIEKIIKKYGEVKQFKKIIHNKNYGRGKSVRDGIEVSEGDIVGFVDIDLDVHPRYIPSMISAIRDDGYDVATAFRYYKAYLRPQLILRHIFSHGYRFISRILLNENLKDSESGYKFFKKDKIMPLVRISRYNGWFWDTEIMCYCIYKGYKIKEISCVLDRKMKKTSAVRVIPTILDYLKNLINFKIYLLKNRKSLFKN